MSDDTAVLYGISYSFDETFCAVVLPTTEDSLPRRQGLFAGTMLQSQGRAINGFAACLIAIRDGQTIPPWCTIGEYELLSDTNGNGLLDARISIDPRKLPA